MILQPDIDRIFDEAKKRRASSEGQLSGLLCTDEDWMTDEEKHLVHEWRIGIIENERQIMNKKRTNNPETMRPIRASYEAKRIPHKVNLRSLEGDQYDEREAMLELLAKHHDNRTSGVWIAIEREAKRLRKLKAK